MPRSIYFDYNATTPLDPAVREAMLPYLDELWGNPSSVHHIGRKARAMLDDARDRIANFLGAKTSEIVFTSGGTESNNLAIFGTARRFKSKGKHLITSTVEHHAVSRCFNYLENNEGFSVTRLPVNAEGRVSVDDLKNSVRPDTILISIMAANNEIGTLQPVTEIGSFCRERQIFFHTDAIQWFGKEPFANIHQFNADLVSICPHKFHGPKGVGLLFIKSPLLPDPILFGGGQENNRRSGTENFPAIIGLVNAIESFIKPYVFDKVYLKPLVDRLVLRIASMPGCKLISPLKQSLVNTVAFTVEGSDGIALIGGLDLEGICASSGSACSSGSVEPSHVVLATGRRETANSLVRFSLGRHSTEAEVDFVCSALPFIIHRAQRASFHANVM
jgi:cysteine desulfurase